MSKRTFEVVTENQTTASRQCEAVEALFGDHPEDVISPIKSAAEAFGWIEEILLTIVRDTDGSGRSTLRIKRLADAGAYLACEFSNYTGCEHERLLGRLQAAGVVADEVKR